MMSSPNNKVLYAGVTNNLVRRVYENKIGLIGGFTKKYNCKKLVWFKDTNDIKSAIQQEKRMKRWKRKFKENLISEMNPNWDDLYENLI